MKDEAWMEQRLDRAQAAYDALREVHEPMAADFIMCQAENAELRRELEAARRALQAAPEAHLEGCFVGGDYEGGKLSECVPGCPTRLRREALAERLKAEG